MVDALNIDNPAYFGLEKNTNGMASGPKSAAITTQKVALLPRVVAT